MSDSRLSPGAHGSSAKFRPSSHGTYSWGNHSWAAVRWRSRMEPTSGSSSSRISVGVTVAVGIGDSSRDTKGPRHKGYGRVGYVVVGYGRVICLSSHGSRRPTE